MPSKVVLVLFAVVMAGLPGASSAAAQNEANADPHEHSTSSHEHPAGDAVGNRADDSPSNGGTGPLVITGCYCLLIVLASMAGGWLPSFINLTHKRLQIMISLVGGLMLGIGIFHMLPHAIAEFGGGGESVDRAAFWMMIGLITMFFLLRTFHFHQHEPVDGSVDGGSHQSSGHDHDHDHDHSHAASYDHATQKAAVHRFSWLGIAFGLGLHTLIDGLALGASVQADAGHHEVGWLLGVGTFLAILLHKPLDAVSITSLMSASGWSAGARNLVNIGFAMMCPIGAGLFFLGVERFSENQHVFVGSALAFSAGVFLCISLGDLLPEIEFHAHNRVVLSVSLLAGIGLAWVIGFLEPDHVHGHSEQHTEAVSEPHGEEHQHDHDHGHDHD